jgi:hypothetical protein
MEILLAAFLITLGYVAYLRIQIHAQQRELAEFKRSVVMVPLPKKRHSPWITLFAISTLLLALAVLLLAMR